MYNPVIFQVPAKSALEIWSASVHAFVHYNPIKFSRCDLLKKCEIIGNRDVYNIKKKNMDRSVVDNRPLSMGNITKPLPL